MNYVEAISAQIERAHVLIRRHEWRTLRLKEAIYQGEAAIASGDVERMRRAFEDLEDCE